MVGSCPVCLNKMNHLSTGFLCKACGYMSSGVIKRYGATQMDL